MRFAALVYLASTTLLVSACKSQSSNSNAKTIENFSDAKQVTEYNCAGTLPRKIENVVFLDKSLQTKLSQEQVLRLMVATETSLGAVPSRFANFFFRQGQGRIVLVEDAESFCYNIISSADERHFLQAKHAAVESCWDVRGDRPTIFLKADPSVITHHLLRAMGRLLVELYLPLAAGDNRASAAEAKDVVRFKELLKNLGDTFVAEVTELKAANKTSLSLDGFKDLLAAGNLAGRRRFDAYLFAEAFDSFFCTSSLPEASPKNSRSNFKRLTPSTYAVFAPYGLAADRVGLALADGDEKFAPSTDGTGGDGGGDGGGPGGWTPPVNSRTITVGDGMPKELVGMTVPFNPSTGQFQTIPVAPSAMQENTEAAANYRDTYKEITGFAAGSPPGIVHQLPTAAASGYFDAQDPYWQATLENKKNIFGETVPGNVNSVEERINHYNTAVTQRYAPPTKSLFTRLFAW